MSAVLLGTSLMGSSLASPSVPEASRPALPRTRLRLTRRGRVVFTVLAAMPIVIGVLIGSLASGGAMAGIDDGRTAVLDTIVVGGGDTLWGIAESIAPSADPREVIHEIMRLNGLRDAVVQPGQRLALPVVE
ncbi:LysM peptidoglycan-binding domain-containing protein [Agromyces sp. NPDC056523]|uniref:LysM peptidoglycan-binding domain-containing protein n=1 Tax=Agromyces sp. NPDC056523 TaxID=3345850 RepID=UPI00366FF6A3